MWARFVRDVLKPYICSLQSNIERSFQHIEVLGAFSVLDPYQKFIPGQDATVIQEWTSYKQHVLVGSFKDKTQAEIMQLLASEKDEWAEIYPNLRLLSSAGLVIPVSSVNCERDFSTMNRVKTDLRNRLKGEHLAACLRIAVNGPAPEAFPYAQALELFFNKPRQIKCSDKQCHLCAH
ncbi:Zinc finger protein 862 [Dissostichus eleginoides]|uniref:Zinc finger protein 862 n=1 Tax=Dissostichus eleginoides TaxID=100907 RepID=A0AAD9FGF3_DISEL|nr:Zinc finger protein 862 [Dissostichus eleginoides]